jgi:hypothetical protein
VEPRRQEPGTAFETAPREYDRRLEAGILHQYGVRETHVAHLYRLDEVKIPRLRLDPPVHLRMHDGAPRLQVCQELCR